MNILKYIIDILLINKKGWYFWSILEYYLSILQQLQFTITLLMQKQKQDKKHNITFLKQNNTIL